VKVLALVWLPKLTPTNARSVDCNICADAPVAASITRKQLPAKIPKIRLPTDLIKHLSRK
jgi:hypothetical protein